MKRYWQFLVVGVICLLAALLWAQPSHKPQQSPAGVRAQSPSQPALQRPSSQRDAAAAPDAKNGKNGNAKDSDDGDDPLPGSSSSLPLLAVIGFGVLAGGITSAMRTRE